jgi:plasmid stabilization system protein ParE
VSLELVFRASTANDLDWFAAYYSQVFPDGAKKASQRLLRILDIIADNPMIGRKSEGFAAIREFAVPRTPFAIIYTVTDHQIEVLRVWDQRRKR